MLFVSWNYSMVPSFLHSLRRREGAEELHLCTRAHALLLTVDHHHLDHPLLWRTKSAGRHGGVAKWERAHSKGTKESLFWRQTWVLTGTLTGFSQMPRSNEVVVSWTFRSNRTKKVITYHIFRAERRSYHSCNDPRISSQYPYGEAHNPQLHGNPKPPASMITCTQVHTHPDTHIHNLKSNTS